MKIAVETMNRRMKVQRNGEACSIGQCTVLEFRIDPQLTVKFVFEIKHWLL